MDAFFQSLLFVALSEIGDKTQLLSVLLVTRFRKPWLIIGGILVATLLNHGASVWLGHTLGQFSQSFWFQLLLSLVFIGLGLWILKPDTLDDKEPTYGYGAFLTTLILFFFAEIGDKTQVATIGLGATYLEAFWPVLVGTTLGMLVADVPAVFFGEKILKHIPLHLMRWITAIFFIGFGMFYLLNCIMRG
jgi:putative Ca2+/H+ antiporter (TMEM165/GDT1 family)